MCCLLNRSNAQYYTITSTIVSESCGPGSVNLSVKGGTHPLFFNWSDGGSDSIRPSLTAGNYNLTIIDSKGRDTTVLVTVTKDYCEVSIPSVFTPNGDGINDVMGIGFVDLYPDFLFQVFNRWGQKVHEQKGPFIPWDGKQFGINLPDESYYYIFYYYPNKEVIL